MIGRLERGEIAPSFETIERLMVALDVAPSEFFGGQSGATSLNTAKLLAALALLQEMPEDKFSQALGVLKAP